MTNPQLISYAIVKSGTPSSNMGNKTKMPTKHHFYSTWYQVLATVLRQDKEIKGIQIGKKEVKLSLFVDDTMVYTEHPRLQKTIRINDLSKVADIKYIEICSVSIHQ